jgi:hypothetical protein
VNKKGEPKHYAHTEDSGAKRYWRTDQTKLPRLEYEKQQKFWSDCRMLIALTLADSINYPNAVKQVAKHLRISRSRLERMALKRNVEPLAEYFAVEPGPQACGRSDGRGRRPERALARLPMSVQSRYWFPHSV